MMIEMQPEASNQPTVRILVVAVDEEARLDFPFSMFPCSYSDAHSHQNNVSLSSLFSLVLRDDAPH